MIPFDFEYYHPSTVQEALDTFLRLDREGKQPMYYGGGTEIISMARTCSLYTGAVIDIKDIPECSVMEFRDGHLTIGSGVTLCRITESGLFPALGAAASRIADHTIQCKITLGGNLCGTIIYREAVLPLLLTDSQVVVHDGYGSRTIGIHDIFHERLRLGKGDLLTQVITAKDRTALPYVHVKTTKLEKIDYPLVTVVAIRNGGVRAAYSGLCAFPFECREMDEALNATAQSPEDRAQQAIDRIPATLNDDLHGSAGYRRFVVKNILVSVLEQLDGGVS